jgi:hypothetical protein
MNGKFGTILKEVVVAYLIIIRLEYISKHLIKVKVNLSLCLTN